MGPHLPGDSHGLAGLCQCDCLIFAGIAIDNCPCGDLHLKVGIDAKIEFGRRQSQKMFDTVSPRNINSTSDKISLDEFFDALLAVKTNRVIGTTPTQSQCVGRVEQIIFGFYDPLAQSPDQGFIAGHIELALLEQRDIQSFQPGLCARRIHPDG